MNDNSLNRGYSLSNSQAITNAFMRGVYMWMSIGLAVTAFVSWIFASSGLTLVLLQNNFIWIGLVIAQFGLVIALSAAMPKLSAGAATGMFILYSALTGCTLSSIFFVYHLGSIAKVFITCTGMFAAVSVYGLATKKDLTSLGSFCFMGLVGIVIAMLVNLFLRSSQMDFIISFIGVFVFLGLTAYDSQKLRNMGASAPMDDAVAIRRGTIMGALTLYLDFINLFLMLLRLFGDRR